MKSEQFLITMMSLWLFIGLVPRLENLIFLEGSVGMKLIKM